jgi:hypothetical protein
MALFLLTTNKEVATKIKDVCASDVLMANRSFKIKGVIHETEYSDVLLESRDEDGPIKPADLFWLGFYTGARVANP